MKLIPPILVLNQAINHCRQKRSNLHPIDNFYLIYPIVHNQMKKLLTIILLLLSTGAFAQRSYKPANPIIISRQNNVTISSYQITGGLSSCILLRDCSNVRITNCRLKDSKKEAILIEHC